MSEAPPENDPATTPPDSTASEPDDAKPDTGGSRDWAKEADKWKALARKHEGTAKANAEAAKRLTEIEESQKTETQKLADKVSAAERERDDARTELAKMRAAVKHGIAEEDLDLLGTGSEEEILARAKRVAERLGAKKAPDFDGGPRKTADKPADMNTLIRRAAGYQ
jgi:uncharacterized membrane protein YqiK